MGITLSMIDIFFIVAAIAIAFRIYSVLGRRTGLERRPSDVNSFSFDMGASAESAQQTEEDFGELTSSVQEFRKHDVSFHPTIFLEKAGKAMEIILSGFFKGDRETLKMLLSEKLLEEFLSLIKKREGAHQTAELSYFRLVSSKIHEMEVTSLHLRIVVVFKTEQTLVVKDETGKIVEGDENIIETIDDEWTFMRPLKSKQPTWLLAKIK